MATISTAIHPHSSVVPLREFDLFVVPPTQTTVERNIISTHRPLAPIDASTNSLLQFEISTPEDEYLRLHDLELYLKMRIDLIKLDNNQKEIELTQEDWGGISPVNNLLHSMIKQIDFYVGTKQVISTSSTYPYKALLEKRLSFTKDAKETLLTTALYYKDDEDNLDGVNKVRNKYIAHKPSSSIKTAIGVGEVLELQDRLHFDLAWQCNALIGGCTVRFHIQFHDPKFYLIVNDNLVPQVKILDATLISYRSKVAAPIVLAHAAGMSVAPAKYPFVWSVVKEHTIARGNYEGIWDNVIHGILPRRIILGMVTNEAFTGSYKKNPFNFQSFNLTNLEVSIDGETFPPGGYQLDVKNNVFVKALRGFYQASTKTTTIT